VEQNRLTVHKNPYTDSRPNPAYSFILEFQNKKYKLFKHKQGSLNNLKVLMFLEIAGSDRVIKTRSIYCLRYIMEEYLVKGKKII